MRFAVVRRFSCTFAMSADKERGSFGFICGFLESHICTASLFLL